MGILTRSLVRETSKMKAVALLPWSLWLLPSPRLKQRLIPTTMVPTVLAMAMVATLAFTMARGMPMLKPSPTTMVPMVLDMVDSMDTVSAMDMATVSTMARERLRLMLSPRLRLIPTTIVPTVLDMVDSMDMVSAIMATVSTTARGRLRLRPSPTTMDMEDTDMPAPTEDSTAEDTTGDKSSGPPSQ